MCWLGCLSPCVRGALGSGLVSVCLLDLSLGGSVAKLPDTPYTDAGRPNTRAELPFWHSVLRRCMVPGSHPPYRLPWTCHYLCPLLACYPVAITAWRAFRIYLFVAA